MTDFYLINKKNNEKYFIGNSNGFGTFWCSEHFSMLENINENNFIVKSSKNNTYTIPEFFHLLSQHLNIIVQN